MTDRRGRGGAPVAAQLLFGAVLAAALGACAGPSPTTAPTAPAGPTTPAATIPASDVPPTTIPVETPEDTGGAGTPPCPLADLKASHGLVEGAAGSLLTEVVLVSASTCSVDAFPPLGLRDATGAGLIGAPSAGPGAIDLVAGVAYTSVVRLGNWCAPEPPFPMSLEIIVGGEELEVTGGSFPDEGDLPPCNGAGGPILEGTGWTPTP